MSDIHIVRTHTMPLKKAKDAANDFARQLKEKFDLAYEWEGETLNFQRPGAQGTLTLTKSEVTIDVTLGFLLKAFKGTMTGHINDNLDKLFGAAGGATATAGKAPAKKAAKAK